MVAAEVAAGLDAPLDVLVVRKLGFPGHEELAVGAVASGGAVVLNEDVLAQAGLDEAALARRAAERQQAVAEMERRLRGDRPAPALAGRTVVLVDDGLATGATMRVAAMAARRAGAARVVVAVPVGSPEAVRSAGGPGRRGGLPGCADEPAGRRPALPGLLAGRGGRGPAAATLVR